MKRVLIIFALAAFTTGFAQENKSEKQETVTTKISVKDNQGVRTDVREEKITKKQPIKLNPNDAGKIDQEYTVGSPKIKTDVTYNSSEHNYMFENEEKGFKVYDTKDGEKKDAAVLRPTSQKGYYIMSQAGGNSFGYFNNDGNFVVESYNPTTDSVEQTTYRLELKSKSSMKK